MMQNPITIVHLSSSLGGGGAEQMVFQLAKQSNPIIKTIVISISELNTLEDKFINENIVVTSYHPGWVRTDMGGNLADISPEESATGLLKHFLNLKKEDTGKFFNYDGSTLPL